MQTNQDNTNKTNAINNAKGSYNTALDALNFHVANVIQPGINNLHTQLSALNDQRVIARAAVLNYTADFEVAIRAAKNKEKLKLTYLTDVSPSCSG